jgi:hypothetical protein
MKKAMISIFCMLIITIAAVMTGCGNKGTQLPLAFEAGDVHRYEHFTSTKTVTTITMLNTNQTQTETNMLQFTFKVAALNPDGFAEMNVTIDGAKATQRISGGMPGMNQNTGEIMDQVAKSIVGKSLTLSVSPQGEVSSIDGMSEIRNAATTTVKAELEKMANSGMPGVDMVSGTLKAQVDAAFSHDAFKVILEEILIVRPPKAIKEGDSWLHPVTTVSGIPLMSNNTYTLTQRGESDVILNESSQIKTSSDNGVEVSGMRIAFDVEGTGTSTVRLDKTTFWVNTVTGETALKGSMTISGGILPSEMKMPMIVETTSTIQKL